MFSQELGPIQNHLVIFSLRLHAGLAVMYSYSRLSQVIAQDVVADPITQRQPSARSYDRQGEFT